MNNTQTLNKWVYKSFQFDILSPQWLDRRSTDQRLQRLLSTAEEWKAIVFSRDFLNDRRRTAPESQLLLVCAITLKDMSYESSQLKPEINKMTEKKEKSGYQGQYKRRKKFRMGTWKRGLVDDMVELKRFRIRVIDST